MAAGRRGGEPEPPPDAGALQRHGRRAPRGGRRPRPVPAPRPAQRPGGIGKKAPGGGGAGAGSLDRWI